MEELRLERREDAPADRTTDSPATDGSPHELPESPATPVPAHVSGERPTSDGRAEPATESPATSPPLPPPRPRRSPLLGATPTSVPTDGQTSEALTTPRRSPLLGATPTAVPTDPQPARTADPPERPRAAAQAAPPPARSAEPESPVEDTVEQGQPAHEEATKRSFWTDRVSIPRQRSARTESVPAGSAIVAPPPEPPSTRLPDSPTDGPAPGPEGAAPAGAGPRKGLTGIAHAVSFNWRSVAALLVALAVAFWIGRGLFGTSTPTASTPSDHPSQKVAVPKEKAHTKKVVIDGSTIRAAGALITLNPALAQPGAPVTVSGSGFDPRSTVDVLLSSEGDATGTSLGSARTDRTGNLNAQVTIPDDVRGGKVIVTAKQENSDNVATAEAVTAAGMGFAKLNKTTGKPGDTLAVSARGFAPGEKINVYWGRASGKPTSTVQASAAGTVSQAPIRVGVGQVGDATLVLVGTKSGTTATVPFYMLGLYPTAAAAPYALKAAEQLTISASGFAPEERVMVYVNTSSGKPALVAKADTQGNVGGLGFKVPFGLKGSQTLVMVGEESRASVSSGFQVLPYTPSAQTSTYGGSPGTSLSFFAKGFAPNEVVMVYLGRTKWSPGELVSAFRVNDRGEAGAAGSFQITGSDQGTLSFTLVGRQSGGQATASLKVTPANGPVDLPPRQKYTLPPSLRR